MNSKIQFLLSLPFALAFFARGQEPVLIQKSATNGNTVTTTTFSSGGVGWPVENFRKNIEEVQNRYQAAMREAMAAAGTPPAIGAGGGFVSATGGRKSAGPALLAARPMEAATRAEWSEDLRVMDKLLRDQVRRVEGEVAQEAMGIRLWHFDRSQTAPQFLDDLGVVFTYDVSFPLAASGKPPVTTGTPSNPTSAWERARNEILGTTRKAASAPGGGMTAGSVSMPFESARVDSLLDALLGTLAEAKHIRHLKPTAVLFVTVLGADDSGAPLRLTLKTSLQDLEKAGGGATAAQLRNAATWAIQ